MSQWDLVGVEMRVPSGEKKNAHQKKRCALQPAEMILFQQEAVRKTFLEEACCRTGRKGY